MSNVMEHFCWPLRDHLDILSRRRSLYFHFSIIFSFSNVWPLQEISLYSGQIQDAVSKALNLKQPTVQSKVFRPALDATLAALLMQLPLQAAQQLSGAEEVDPTKTAINCFPTSPTVGYMVHGPIIQQQCHPA